MRRKATTPQPEHTSASATNRTARFLAGHCGYCLSQLVTTTMQGAEPMHLDGTPYSQCKEALRARAKTARTNA